MCIVTHFTDALEVVNAWIFGTLDNNDISHGHTAAEEIS
jgi:hypothetical protein